MAIVIVPQAKPLLRTILAFGLAMAATGVWAQATDPKPETAFEVFYPAQSKREEEEGRVLLKLVIRSDGQVASVEVVSSSGFPRLDEEAKRAALKQRFVPATRNGTPVETTVQLPIVFKLSPTKAYLARIATMVKQRIPSGGERPGTPVTEVDVRLESDGKIVSTKLVRGSGDNAWDAAVLQGLTQVGPLPPDEDGKVPDSLTLRVTANDEVPKATSLPRAPSAGYAARVIAAVKTNIFTEENVPGNPVAEVEVRLALDGEILGIRLNRSSGNKTWDNAVVRALARTKKLPLDVDGRVPPGLVIAFRPKE